MNKWMSFYSLTKRCLIGIHLFFIGMMLFGPTVQKQKKHQSLIVKTVQFKPSVPVKTELLPQKTPSSQKNQKERSIQKESAPAIAPTKKTSPKKEASKSVSKQSETPKKEKSSKKGEKKQNTPHVSQDLVRDLREKIERIEKQKKELMSSKPQKQEEMAFLPLQIDMPIEVDEERGGYVEELLSCLYQNLQLPEIGAVKIQLTLRQDGSIDRLVVLQAQSKRNRAYLEEKLPVLKFPPVEGKGPHVFTLNFCNVEG